MENQGKLMPESETGWSAGEEGVSPDLLAVRSVLRGLPTLKCSSGFEYRLQRKLSGEESGVRVAGPVRNWTLGWAGAGLGFATALAIAFFAFDISGPTHSDSQMANTPPKVSATSPSASQPISTSDPGTDKSLASAKKDSIKPPVSKLDLNQNDFHTASSPQK